MTNAKLTLFFATEKDNAFHNGMPSAEAAPVERSIFK